MREVEPGWRLAVFICHNERDSASGRASCGAARGASLRAWLRDSLREAGLKERVLCTRSGCLGVCSPHGTTVALIDAGGAPREVVVLPPDGDREELLRRVLDAVDRADGSRDDPTGRTAEPGS